MVRRRIALTILPFLMLAALTACRQVPEDTLNGDDNSPEKESEAQFDAVAAAEDAESAFQVRPRTVQRVKQSAELFAQALERDDARKYEHLWKAARVSAWLAEWLDDADEREKHARQGLKYANTALEKEPDGGEASYFRGVLAGFLGELDNSYGLDAVKRIRDAMEGLIERDFDIDHAGPWRVYGVMLMRTPGPPVSIGSLRNARRIMNEMIDRAPDWPENQLYYAEFEFVWSADRDDPAFAESARERLDTHLLGADASPPEGYEFEFKRWQEAARNLLDEHTD